MTMTRVLVLLLGCLALLRACDSLQNQDQKHKEAALHSFFSGLDTNRDGQIEEDEAAQFVGVEFDRVTEGWSLGEQLQAMVAAIDGGDTGNSLSEGEIEQHLKGMLQVGTAFGLQQRANKIGLPALCRA